MNGSLENNIVGTTGQTATQTVWLDPSAEPSQRFRGISGFTHSTSPDGLNWTKADQEWDVPAEPLCIGDWGSGGGDTQAVAFVRSAGHSSRGASG